jgi:hypothetical protein
MEVIANTLHFYSETALAAVVVRLQIAQGSEPIL